MDRKALVGFMKSIDRSHKLSRTFKMSVDGELVSGSSTFPVYNPSTEEKIADCPNASEEQLNQAVSAAKHAFKTWSRTTLAERQACLRAVAKELSAPNTIAELARTLTLEQGKPLMNSVFEILGGVKWMQVALKMELPPIEILRDDKKARYEVRYRPLGVCACICPWNFPLTQPQWKLIPALLAGNTVVLKPSPYTPLATLLLGEIYARHFPKGVVNFVSGGNELGAWMTAHPDIAKVSFTGSTATGKKIQEVVAKDLKRTTMELGGNDAAIVMPDADVKKVAPAIFQQAFGNTGQVCVAIKRVFVHEDQYADFVKSITEVATAAKPKCGDGMNPGTLYGPLCNKMQFDKVNDYVEDARTNGAMINCGGKRMGTKGYYYEPTIISDVNDTFRIVKEEQFGPALPILKYSSVDEAVDRANSSKYGLGGSVWGGDAEAASEVALNLECGTAWVNQHQNIRPDLPFGGAKWSGLGLENGKWGLASFMQAQTINVVKTNKFAKL